MPNYSIFILSGGKSRRMGEDKGLIDFQGKPMIKHLIDRFTNIVPEITIISNTKGYHYINNQVIKDNYQNCGPVGGIEAGLAFSKSEINLFLSCDSPFVELSLIEYLIKNKKNEVVFSKFKNTHPFPGLYSKSIHEKLKSLIEKGFRKMNDLEKHFNVSKLDCSHFNQNNFINFNSLQDIKNWNENNY